MLWLRLLSLMGVAVIGLAQTAPQTSPRPAPHFTADERAAVMAFWASPGTWIQGLPAAHREQGVWHVRLTVEGSTWLWNYNRARGLPKGPPGQTPAAQNPEEEVWERWINAKVAWDRYHAARVALEANEALGIQAPAIGPVPPDPGPIPESLLALVGNPPAFAAARAPIQHEVDFGDGFRKTFVDHVPMRERFAFYRFNEGVQDVGQRVREMPASELDRLFSAARVNLSIRRVMQAVSLLEGGFESVNTYDTGFLSVGLIQFATLREGGGSLGAVLQRQKRDDPTSFQRDFRQYGIDVSAEGLIVAVDPATGAELVGLEAVRQIILDKRLTAVFARAGARSDPFRIAQIQIAREQYYPDQDVITVQVGDLALSARVPEIFRSEAGMATLMDRKVNTGRLDPLPEVLGQLVRDRGLQTLYDASAHELELIRRMRFRKDYTVDMSLSQPRELDNQPSRSGERTGRGSPPRL